MLDLAVRFYRQRWSQWYFIQSKSSDQTTQNDPRKMKKRVRKCANCFVFLTLSVCIYVTVNKHQIRQNQGTSALSSSPLQHTD